MLSGFFLNRGPHGQVFVREVEVKSTLYTLGDSTVFGKCRKGLPHLHGPPLFPGDTMGFEIRNNCRKGARP